jgi:phage gp36-like protein
MKTPVERVERYKRAIEWLKDVADGMVTPNGLPIVTDPDTGADVNAGLQWGSEDKYYQGW